MPVGAFLFSGSFSIAAMTTLSMDLDGWADNSLRMIAATQINCGITIGTAKMYISAAQMYI